MSRSFPYIVRRVGWNEASDLLSRVRRLVFIEEQHVPETLEWDGSDEHCAHVLAQTPTGDPIGTGRLLPDGHIGRMAVVREWRCRGVGGALLRELVEMARVAGFREVRLNAQTRAMAFYTRHGFVPEGPEFFEVGIPHRHMRRALGTPPGS